MPATTQEEVLNALKDCYDPEIPVNIVDLGLVYDMQIQPLPSGRNAVAVKMTLTAQGCGMGGAISADAQQKLLGLPGVANAHPLGNFTVNHYARIEPSSVLA